MRFSTHCSAAAKSTPSLALTVPAAGVLAAADMGEAVSLDRVRVAAAGSSRAASQPTAYHSRSGYGGAQLTFTLSRQTGRFWLGAFLRASTVRHAVFDDSPLVRRNENLIAGLAVAWMHTRSTELVERRADE